MFNIPAESAQNCTSSNTCLYGVKYGSGYTVGFLATETLTITPSDVFENFVIGCGERNGGRFSRTAGLLGLGPLPYSLTITNFLNIQKPLLLLLTSIFKLHWSPQLRWWSLTSCKIHSNNRKNSGIVRPRRFWN